MEEKHSVVSECHRSANWKQVVVKVSPRNWRNGYSTQNTHTTEMKKFRHKSQPTRYTSCLSWSDQMIAHRNVVIWSTFEILRESIATIAFMCRSIRNSHILHLTLSLGVTWQTTSGYSTGIWVGGSSDTTKPWPCSRHKRCKFCYPV